MKLSTSLSVCALGLAAAFASAAVAPSPAFAQSAEDAATAETLFREAKKLMKDGNYSQACPKLEASYRIDPAIGTLLNLADCHEKTDLTASAWAEFLRAASLAKREGQSTRAKVARDRAEALEPRLVRVKIEIGASDRHQGMKVQLDDKTVEPAALGVPTPVDPGQQRIRVTAPGYEAWEGSVSAMDEGETYEIVVPPLTPAPEAAPADYAASDEPEGSQTDSRARTFRTLGWTSVGIGAAGLVAGGVLGFVAKDKWDSSGCSGGSCPDAGAQSQADDAGTFADFSTTAFVVGGVFAATGITLLITAPKSGGPEDTATLQDLRLDVYGSPSSASFSLSGSF